MMMSLISNAPRILAASQRALNNPRRTSCLRCHHYRLFPGSPFSPTPGLVVGCRRYKYISVPVSKLPDDWEETCHFHAAVCADYDDAD